MTGLKTSPSTPGLHKLYIPAVCLLIAFQGYFSQYVFDTSPDLAPGALTDREFYTFNALLLTLWWTYYKACAVDPGRYIFPPSSTSPPPSSKDSKQTIAKTTPERWCKKCAAPKPPRAHHCRHCNRCIPRMDHHCPWTGTCVSLQTFPYFLRFLVWTNITLFYFLSLLWARISPVWADRHLPSYLGPTLFSLTSLTLLFLSNILTIFALLILLVTTLKSWVFNTTMIESWEISRHESLLERLDESSDSSSPSSFWSVESETENHPSLYSRIEFPYDLGIFQNMSQAMGTSNFLLWFFPFYNSGPVINNKTPGKGIGWEYEENGFNDVPNMWPPPDPEKLRRQKQGGWPAAQERLRRLEEEEAYYYGNNNSNDNNTPTTGEDIKAAFAKRQQQDLLRKKRAAAAEHMQSGILVELEEDEDDDNGSGRTQEEFEWVGKPAWTNSEGDRLWDYGVDEDAEEDVVDGEIISSSMTTAAEADDDVPLAELIRRRKVVTREDE
ncbi:Palmitoyltransferase PFA4 [Podospora australis]|uniref:Palmitoyltransferase PFA4 n=1 Tax=Podospora australis TaxID=1536484 RepID=A0AAN6X4Z2_9PEZI|nr:Palmitoyltransferase PFA4 [Podospora australis]